MTIAASWTAAALLMAGFVQDDELGQAAAKAAAMTKYAFKFSSNLEGGKGGNRPPIAVDAKFDGENGVEFKLKQGAAYRKGDILVYQDGDDWKKLEQPQKKGEGGEGRKGTGIYNILRGVQAPHELLTNFVKKLKAAKKADAKENECSVYAGDLTDEAAKELTGHGRRGGGADIVAAGSARVWIDAKGALVKLEITTTLKGKAKDRDVDTKMTRTYEISEVGTAAFTLPDGAKKALGAGE